MFTTDQVADASQVIELLRRQHLKVTTAELFTGGLIAALLTEIAGSSDVVDRAFVTYSNAAKMEVVAVPEALLTQYGAVSEEVARAMASGALTASCADVAVSATGVAGPGGGTAAKPVGLVHLAAARRDGAVLHLQCRFGDIGRSQIRARAVTEGLALVRSLVT